MLLPKSIMAFNRTQGIKPLGLADKWPLLNSRAHHSRALQELQLVRSGLKTTCTPFQTACTLYRSQVVLSHVYVLYSCPALHCTGCNVCILNQLLTKLHTCAQNETQRPHVLSLTASMKLFSLLQVTFCFTSKRKCTSYACLKP